MSVYNVLYILLVFSFALSAAAMWVNWHLNRHELAVRDWAIALSLIMVGCSFAIIARLNVEDAQAFVPLNFFSFLRDLGTAINGLAWMVVWSGILRFLGRPIPSVSSLFLFWLAFFGLILVGHPLEMPAAWNVAWVSLLISATSLMILYEILRPGIGGVASWVACAGFSLATLTWGIRALMSFIDLSRPIDSTFDTIVMFGAVISAYACMMGLILLTNQRLIDRLGTFANSDPLTTVLNRRAFFESVDPLFLNEGAIDQVSSVVLLDLDNFSEINEEHGYQSGDKALRQISLLSMQLLGRNDLFARYGGDEFVFLLHNKNREQARIVMNRLQALVQQSIIESDQGIFQVRLSMGISEHICGENIHSSIARANQALAKAKSTGHSRIVFHEQEQVLA